MANVLRIPDTKSYITWRQGLDTNKKGGAFDLVLRNEKGEPIAKAKLTSEQLHKYICLHNTMK